MSKVIVKKSKKPVIGSDGKTMYEVWYRGRRVDTVGSKREVQRIKDAIARDERIEKNFKGK